MTQVAVVRRWDVYGNTRTTQYTAAQHAQQHLCNLLGP